MPAKGTKQSAAGKEAGASNLAKWQSESGHHLQALRHGVYSQTVRQRYSDLRTNEGKRLKTVMDSIVDDLGGAEQLNSAQNVILGGLRSKFIVVFQIGKYLDRQFDIIDSNGELLACLKSNFLQYSESIRRDLETLYAVRKSITLRRVPKLEELIKSK